MDETSTGSAPVSVGPSRFAVLPQATAGAPEVEKTLAAADGGAPGSGAIAAVAAAAVAAKRVGVAVVRGRRRGFAEFSEQAQVCRSWRRIKSEIDCVNCVALVGAAPASPVVPLLRMKGRCDGCLTRTLTHTPSTTLGGGNGGGAGGLSSTVSRAFRIFSLSM